MSIDTLRTDGRGRVRPGRPWQRVPVAVLRISRLARDIEFERDRHPDDSPVYALLSAAVTATDEAAAAIPPD